MTRRHPIFAALAAIVPVVLAGVAGSHATLPAIPTWYATLEKPWFTPPNWVFGPAWTVFYIAIAYAFWRILTLDRPLADKRAAILVFLVQIFLNGLWSVVFFGIRSPGGGLIVIAALWIAIAANIFAFGKLDRLAAWLLVPYLAWVSFAAALNTGVYLLN
ncbi:MAG: TspO/MBR family protein [Rhodoblastus sp.]